MPCKFHLYLQPLHHVLTSSAYFNNSRTHGYNYGDNSPPYSPSYASHNENSDKYEDDYYASDDEEDNDARNNYGNSSKFGSGGSNTEYYRSRKGSW
jgi:hypothetical protein